MFLNVVVPQMMKRNTISFEFMRVGTAKLLYKAVIEAPSLWRTYYLPKPESMVGNKVDIYDPGHIQVLVDYIIHPDVSIGGFYTKDDRQNVRLSQSSIGGGASTHQSTGLDSPSGDKQPSQTSQGAENISSEPVAVVDSDDDVVCLQSHSEDNDVCDSYFSDSACSREYSTGVGFEETDINDTSSLVERFRKGKEHVDVSDDEGIVVHTHSEEADVSEKRKETALIALQAEKRRRDERRKQNSKPNDYVEPLSPQMEVDIVMYDCVEGTQKPNEVDDGGDEIGKSHTQTGVSIHKVTT